MPEYKFRKSPAGVRHKLMSVNGIKVNTWYTRVEVSLRRSRGKYLGDKTLWTCTVVTWFRHLQHNVEYDTIQLPDHLWDNGVLPKDYWAVIHPLVQQQLPAILERRFSAVYDGARQMLQEDIENVVAKHEKSIELNRALAYPDVPAGVDEKEDEDE